ncbi:MAG: SnoaL-like domain-containing protein [Nanoarchaeota archaeon]|nr:SnoaL-like domain-containing protein [Nanoarchaeota archaeon]
MNNVELTKQFYNAFKNKDSQTYLSLCDKDIQWITLDGMPSGGRYVGVKEIFENYFPKMLSNFKEFHAIPEEYIESQDGVIVIGRYTGISKKDKQFDVPFSHVYEINNGKITKFRQFTDTSKIQESLS